MSYIVPEVGVRELYPLHSVNGLKKIFKNKTGSTITLRPYKSLKRKKGKPSYVLEMSEAQIAHIYVSKVIGENYGYGRFKDSMDLIIINLADMESLWVTVYGSGWLFFDMLFVQHINNKLE